MKINYFMFLLGLIMGYKIVCNQMKIICYEDDDYWYKNCGWS